MNTEHFSSWAQSRARESFADFFNVFDQRKARSGLNTGWRRTFISLHGVIEWEVERGKKLLTDEVTLVVKFPHWLQGTQCFPGYILTCFYLNCTFLSNVHSSFSPIVSSCFIWNLATGGKKEQQLSQKMKLSNMKLSINRTSIQIICPPKILSFLHTSSQLYSGSICCSPCI